MQISQDLLCNVPGHYRVMSDQNPTKDVKVSPSLKLDTLTFVPSGILGKTIPEVEQYWAKVR